MESSSQLTPVYSYQKFKELADDRMVQVKIFIQTAEPWEAAGSGTLQFFQIDAKNCTREIREFDDISPQLRNLYLLIEAGSLRDLPPADVATLQRNKDVLRTKETNNPEVIVFYDLYNGRDFEFDLERRLSRQGDLLGARPRRLAPPRRQLHLGRDALPHLGLPLRGLPRPGADPGAADGGQPAGDPRGADPPRQPDGGVVRAVRPVPAGVLLQRMS